jgi:hypothetical protein
MKSIERDQTQTCAGRPPSEGAGLWLGPTSGTRQPAMKFVGLTNGESIFH